MCFFPLFVSQQVEQGNFCLCLCHDLLSFGFGNFLRRRSDGLSIYPLCVNQPVKLHMRDFVLGLVANALLPVFKSQSFDFRNLGFGQAQFILEAQQMSERAFTGVPAMASM